MHAARNVLLCSKDCLCLFVCPTGATDTEDGQVDFSKCLDGCRLCIDACPSHALYLVPDNYALPQKKSDEMKSCLKKLAKAKIEQECLSASLEKSAKNPIERQLAHSFAKSNRIMAEDCVREAGFMLPQSEEVRSLLAGLLEQEQPEGFPREVVEELLTLLG
ncbi:4Fe-4S ferredoxin [uncultured Sphaerochaeta sp.]|uniref:4Fe-4S ferredoxin n=1 Tax=uncultured Sphaerochaeta sp. TaxID=886478 RepID=UPI002A0A8A1E|nr:4Fe-4S ferredoxin [uncultured Sphaerochaeta sp.]